MTRITIISRNFARESGNVKNELIFERDQSLPGIVCQALFHSICTGTPRESSSEDKEKYFRWRLSQSAIFVNRFGGRFNFRSKSVLDFGCGSGSMCFFLGQKGAARVVGVDIDEERVAFARNKLESEFSNLLGKVEFALPSDLKEERFDLAVSEDCFEHYEDCVGIMKTIRLRLNPGGRVVIGFSPLWKSPYGGHIGYMTKLPWAHLLFPERIIMRERKRYRPDENAKTFSEMRGGLNKMTYAKFIETMQTTGFRIEFLATNVSKSKMTRFVNLIRRLPFCFEYFTKNLYAIVSPEPGRHASYL